MNQALTFHQAGALDTAAQLYAPILDADPGQAHVHHFFDILKHQSGDLAGVDPQCLGPCPRRGCVS